MRYFSLIRDRVDIEPFLEEIAAVGDAWSLATGRQEKIRVQRAALAIPLRGLGKSCIGDRKRRDVMESRWTSGSMAFPHARSFIADIAASLSCNPGREKIVSLPPGKRVYPHVDVGSTAGFMVVFTWCCALLRGPCSVLGTRPCACRSVNYGGSTTNRFTRPGMMAPRIAYT